MSETANGGPGPGSPAPNRPANPSPGSEFSDLQLPSQATHTPLLSQHSHSPLHSDVASASSGDEVPVYERFTSIAMEIAQRLIGADGQVDIDNIDQVLAVPGRLHDLDDYPTQRGHIERMLHALRDDAVLRDIVNSVCADTDPTDLAAEVIGETLNLDTDVDVGAAEARTAVLTAMLGPLRQEGDQHHADVYSCFATSVGVIVHDDMPRRLAQDLKSLIEENCIPIQHNGIRIDVPFASDINYGTQDVKLLRAWEATLASMAHIGVNTSHVDQVRASVVHGDNPEGRADRLSLQGKVEECIRTNKMRMHRLFTRREVDRAGRALVSEIDHLMRQRFSMAKFHADKSSGNYLGATLLYDKSSAHDPANWTCIDSGDAFKAAMRKLVEDAALNVKAAKLRELKGDTELLKGAVNVITKSLVGYITQNHSDDFVRHASTHLDPADSPWQISRGGDSSHVAANYFGRAITRIDSGDYPHNPQKPKDATHIVDFILNRFAGMRNAIFPEVRRSPESFKVSVAVGDHEFLLIPGMVRTGWMQDTHTDDWIDESLRIPAETYLDQRLANPPPLEKLLSDVIGYIDYEGYGIPSKEKKYLIDDIRNLARNRDGTFSESYSPANVYNAIIDPTTYPNIEDQEKFRDAVSAAILRAMPPPTVRFADTLWKDRENPGSPRYMGLLYNPFTETVNIHYMSEDGSNRWPVDEKTLHTPWHVTTTSLHG